jgi:dethiobiotin synthetase
MSEPTSLKRIVVVGTGTEVGKTWLSAALLRVLAASGRSVLGLKPIESGLDGSAPGDADQLAQAAGRQPPPAPYRFAEPISPHLAASRAGRVIELAETLTYVQLQESSLAGQPGAVCLIETAGGLFTPLAPGLTNLDLALALEPARWLLVAPDALGVLHDLTATLTAALARGRAPDAIALSRSRAPDASTGTNAAEVARLGIAPRPYVFPDDGDAGLRDLASALVR